MAEGFVEASEKIRGRHGGLVVGLGGRYVSPSIEARSILVKEQSAVSCSMVTASPRGEKARSTQAVRDL